MGIVSVFYAAFGYLALLAAIWWGTLFVGDGIDVPLMDAPTTVSAREAILVDLGLLLLLALLHRFAARGMLRHITGWAGVRRPGPRGSILRGLADGSDAWVVALALVSIYAGWRAVPQILWNAPGSVQWAISGLFYLAWALILIGAFLPGQTAGNAVPAEKIRAPLFQPLYGGILLAVWTTSVMTVGHLLLAATVTAYLLFDAIWEARELRVSARRTVGSHSSASASRVNA